MYGKYTKANPLLNVLFNLRRLQHAAASCRLDHFRDQFGMRDHLAALHDPHNRGLRLVVSVCRHPLVRRLVLLLSLLQLDLIDLNPHLRVGKVGVICKLVRWIDIFPLGYLG